MLGWASSEPLIWAWMGAEFVMPPVPLHQFHQVHLSHFAQARDRTSFSAYLPSRQLSHIIATKAISTVLPRPSESLLFRLLQLVRVGASSIQCIYINMALRSSPDQEHPHGLFGNKSLDSNTSPGCDRTMETDMASSSSMGPDVTMASGGITGHSDLFGPQHQHWLWPSTWSQTAA